MKRPFRCFIRVLGGCLLVSAVGSGCADDLAVRRVHPAAVLASKSPVDRSPADGGETADCLRALAKPGSSPTDPVARQTRRAAMVRLFELHGPALVAAPRHAITVPAGPGRSLRLVLRRGPGPGGVEPSRFTSLEPVDHFVITRAPVIGSSPGEGAPLIGTLRPVLPVHVPGPVPARPVPGVSWAVTAVPVPGPTGGGAETLFIDLYDPHTTGRTAGGTALAADYTTLEAVVFSHIGPQRRGLRGFLSGNTDFSSAGVFTSELPSTEKIPLVLVHGLLSDPSDFHTLHNALEADAGFRQRYQIWFFYYPSSLPVPYSAMLLREDVEKMIHGLDPAGVHPALHRVVLVGHSMGGVLARLMVSDGGDAYRSHYFRQPVELLHLSTPERTLLRKAFYYRASPDVARVVFIATPHRGSGLAGGLLGNIGRMLVRVPTSALRQVRSIVSNNRPALAAGASLKPGSSLDSLSPRDPLIAAMNDMPLSRRVRINSILGNRGRGGPLEKSSDGVVEYRSSHLPQAESECVVPAGHTGTLARAETAAEIIRVLKVDSGGW